MTLFIIVINRGPKLPPKRYGCTSERYAFRKAMELAFYHGCAFTVAGDANARVLHVDASTWYTRPHN
jgi:hypothetical protein